MSWQEAGKVLIERVGDRNLKARLEEFWSTVGELNRTHIRISHLDDRVYTGAFGIRGSLLVPLASRMIRYKVLDPIVVEDRPGDKNSRIKAFDAPRVLSAASLLRIAQEQGQDAKFLVNYGQIQAWQDIVDPTRAALGECDIASYIHDPIEFVQKERKARTRAKTTRAYNGRIYSGPDEPNSRDEDEENFKSKLSPEMARVMPTLLPEDRDSLEGWDFRKMAQAFRLLRASSPFDEIGFSDLPDPVVKTLKLAINLERRKGKGTLLGEFDSLTAETAMSAILYCARALEDPEAKIQNLKQLLEKFEIEAREIR